MTEEISNDLNRIVDGISSSMDMAEMLSYNIWGAAVTTTRAFEKVTLKADTNTNRVFVSIQLRWWAKFKKFDKIRQAWLRLAEQRCRKQLPEGWNILVYYERNENGFT